MIRGAAALTLLVASAASAQAPKRALTPDDYDRWRAIQGATLSPDGRWAVYTLAPQVGDGALVARATTGSTEYRVPRGFIGRPQLQPAADSNWNAPSGQVTADSRFVLFLTYAPMSDFERARRERRRNAKPGEPRPALGILSLADGKVVTIPAVRGFRLARFDGRFAVYQLEADSALVAADSALPREARRDFGTTLVVRELATGAESRISDVGAYALSDSGRWLAYGVTSRQWDRDGAFVRPLSGGEVRVLASGPGDYRQFAFDKAGKQVAFVSNRDEWTRRSATYKPRFALYHATLPAAARAIVPAAALAGGAVVAERGRVDFSRDGGVVLFATAPAPVDSIPADSLADKAVFDLWHYRDPRLQPQQRKELPRDRSRSFTAVYHLADGRMVQLANDTLRQVTVSEDGRVALSTADLPYAVEAMWSGNRADLYLIDTRTGTRRPLAMGARFGREARLSPGARFVTWYDSGQWKAHDVAANRTVSLTRGINVRFDQETWDTPGDPEPWGVAGWTRGDRTVLIYDRFDVWEMDPTGQRAPRVVTDSVGRRSHLVLRVVDVDTTKHFFEPDETLLLRAFDDSTKASGFYRDQLGVVRQPARIVMDDASFGTPMKARGAEQYLVTRSTFRDFPDLWTGSRLDQLERISAANPQQAAYAWGTAQLVRWRSADGIPLQGILYKPDNFDAKRHYPMVVYFYEQMSDQLHTQDMSVPRNTIKPAHYVSNGYLVFMPDIAYTKGYPGESALKSIVPGVQLLLDSGFVKPDGIGISGQSWGGYQTAYIITRTNIFKAAFAGAPVANMTSAYGGIRWESGLARAFQYEVGQSRIGGSLWEYPMRYIENSPLFAADRIRTPLFIMANDNDGAVPWYQGIELFVALRRLGREVYLIDYNGDEHNPRKRANQKDIAVRQKQFFDHHLLGAPEPDWMKSGIPYLQKGRDQLARPTRAAATPTAPLAPQDQ